MKITGQLYAPISYLEASEKMVEAVVTGCGTGGWKSLLIPDTMYCLDISEACDIHDWMYAKGETEADKKEADEAFLNNLIRIIDTETKFGIIKWLRYRRAKKYYRAVAWFGGPAFWDEKNEFNGEQKPIIKKGVTA